MKNHFLQRFHSLSLRTLLLLMTFALALPSIILIFYSGYLQSEDAIREGIDDGRMLVYSIATEQYNLAGNIEQLLTALAQIPEIKTHDVKTANTILTDILEKNPQYGNIIIADPAGTVWASGLPMKAPFSVHDRLTFQSAVKSRQFSSGDYGIGRISARPTIGFGYPVITASGKLTDVILANINFVQFNMLLNMGGLPRGSSYSILDRNGIIVHRNPNPSHLIGKRIEHDTFMKMVDGPEASNEVAYDANGGKYIVCYRKLRLKNEQSPYLYIRASIPHKETQKKAVSALAKKVIFLAPLLLFALFFVMRLGNIFILKRIDKLQKAVLRLAGGDLKFRVTDEVAGGEFGRLGQAFDEMAEKLASRERALLESEREFADLYNNAPCGYHSLNKEGFFVRINDTELNWLGYERDELIGHMKFGDIITPDGVEILEKSFHLLKELGWVRGLEFELVRKDGSTLPVLLNATALHAPDGSLLVIISTVYDIAERKQVERELNELNNNLTKRIEEETERRVQHERLLARHARLAAMGEMIGAIAHQWRQPLATIGATIQSIRMAWERNCIDRSFLERAEADAQKQLYHMSDTIEDFRNFFLPEKMIEIFDLKEKIEEVVLLVSSQFANSGVRLNVVDNSPDCRLNIKGYQNEFKQSLINLVSNAFDAIMDKAAHNHQLGKGLAAEGQVIVSIAGEGNKAVIEVQDNGCGIPDEYADKVFDPYFTTKSAEKGTGIGLYMTKLIIEESMGGSLSFTSSPDGTKFKVELALDDSVEGGSNG
ncbi:ATP-binding protein [Geobacter sp. AOG2]|uniref:ATP-binding protein n=1 Tax=Geobacter sp. AOG2 TaxID=1566347 RepID=UPI001CC5981A|nr:ATP-binding protein [Geobacter sp. AOG2]GFE62145.1 hypothetical protein AOG2_27330 [Geobacter sp. AOG2]